MRVDTMKELLAPDIGAPEDAHSGTLVEARGARRVLAVDAERRHRLAAVGKAAEAVVEERQAETLPPPSLPHPEPRDEAPVAEALLVVDRRGGDLVAVPDDEDQFRIELRHAEHALLPRFVVAQLVAPLVDEGLVERVFQLPAVTIGVERSQLEAAGPRPRRDSPSRSIIIRW